MLSETRSVDLHETSVRYILGHGLQHISGATVDYTDPFAAWFVKIALQSQSNFHNLANDTLLGISVY